MMTDDERIALLKTPEECDNLAINAAERGSAELALKARKRKIKLMAERDGARNEVEEAAWQGIHSIEEYRRSQGARTWRCNYTRRAIDRRGGDIITVVNDVVAKPGPSDGFHELIDAGLGEFLFEEVVLRYPEHLSAAAQARARERLGP